jgi:hypothetical protein
LLSAVSRAHLGRHVPADAACAYNASAPSMPRPVEELSRRRDKIAVVGVYHRGRRRRRPRRTAGELVMSCESPITSGSLISSRRPPSAASAWSISAGDQEEWADDHQRLASARALLILRLIGIVRQLETERGQSA